VVTLGNIGNTRNVFLFFCQTVPTTIPPITKLQTVNTVLPLKQERLGFSERAGKRTEEKMVLLHMLVKS
jgi:hypothetical protein